MAGWKRDLQKELAESFSHFTMLSFVEITPILYLKLRCFVRQHRSVCKVRNPEAELNEKSYNFVKVNMTKYFS